MEMTKKFSPEFQHDIADLLECCQENETDSLTITMHYGELDLDIDITFSVHPHEEGADDGNNVRQTD